MRPVFIFGGDPGSKAFLSALLASHESFVETPPFTSSYLRATRSRLFGLDESAFGELALGEATEPYFGAFGGARETGTEAIEQLVEAYASDHGHGEAQVWLEHVTPGEVSRLNAAFPEARFLHLVRDGRAVATARWQQPGEPRRPVRAARNWRASILRGLEAEEKLGEGCLRVSYEALLSDLRMGLEALAHALGVSAQRFQIAPAVLYKDYDPHLYDWRTQLTPFEIEDIERVSGALLTELGYGLESPGSGMPARPDVWQRAGHQPLRPTRPVHQPQAPLFQGRDGRPRP